MSDVQWFQDTIDFPCDTKAVVRSIWAGNFFDVPRGLHFDEQAHRLHLHARDEQRAELLFVRNVCALPRTSFPRTCGAGTMRKEATIPSVVRVGSMRLIFK